VLQLECYSRLSATACCAEAGSTYLQQGASLDSDRGFAIDGRSVVKINQSLSLYPRTVHTNGLVDDDSLVIDSLASRMDNIVSIVSSKQA
jgi:hypothetical protein